MELNDINQTSPERVNLNTENENSVKPLSNNATEELSSGNQPDKTVFDNAVIEESNNTDTVSAEKETKPVDAVEEQELPLFEPEAVAEHVPNDKEVSSAIEEHVEEQKTHPAFTDVNYRNLSQAELVGKFKELLHHHNSPHVKEHLEAIKEAFEAAAKETETAAYQIFLDSSEPEENYSPPIAPLQKEFSALLHEYRQKRDYARTVLEVEKERNLKAKYEVIEGIKELINRQESLNNTFQEFRELQQRWREIGPVPQAKIRDLWETFHLHVENFYSYIKINNELRDLDLKKNYEAKLELCEKTEKLLLEPLVTTAFKTLQKHHDRWREIGPVPRDKKEEIWERFKTASNAINQNQHEYFESLREQMRKNLETKTELCEKAEALLTEDIKNPKEWEAKSRQLIDLQQLWKTVGFAQKKDNNKVYNRFRKACDGFFNLKREYFKGHKDEQQNNYQLKMELCMQAEAMKESTEWRKTTEDFIHIQKRWKEIGPAPKKQSEILWKKFRNTCDYFFDRKEQHFNTVDKEQDVNLQKKLDIIEELKNFKISDNAENSFNMLQSFQRRWTEIGYVPLKVKERINQEFRNLVNKLFDQLNIDESNKEIQRFKGKLDSWKDSGTFGEKAGQARNRLMLKIKQLESDIVLWENNIGFFAKSKNSDVLIKEFNKKIETGKQNVKTMQDELTMIESML